MAHLDDAEHCPKGHLMQRTVAWAGQMKMGEIAFKPDYYPSFGKVFTNPSQLKDEIKKQKYENGIDLIEVGNDRAKPTPQKNNINWNEAGYALHQELRKRRAR